MSEKKQYIVLAIGIILYMSLICGYKVGLLLAFILIMWGSVVITLKLADLVFDAGCELLDKFLNWWNEPIYTKEQPIMANFTVTWWKTTKQGWQWVKMIFWIGLVVGTAIYFIFIE